jgi:hypothetical protein
MPLFEAALGAEVGHPVDEFGDLDELFESLDARDAMWLLPRFGR